MDPSLAGVIPGTTGNVDMTSTLLPAGTFGSSLGTGTGQHGTSPTNVGIGGTVQQAITNVWDWLNTPFTTSMSMVDVFLLIGTILVAIILWNLILYHIRIAAETL